MYLTIHTCTLFQSTGYTRLIHWFRVQLASQKKITVSLPGCVSPQPTTLFLRMRPGFKFYCDHHVSAHMSGFMYGVEFLQLRELDRSRNRGRPQSFDEPLIQRCLFLFTSPSNKQAIRCPAHIRSSQVRLPLRQTLRGPKFSFQSTELSSTKLCSTPSSYPIQNSSCGDFCSHK